MKIQQVEELVGISKKNIRFYEEQGLLSPGRAENGYREYGREDVLRLKEIKLLRKLAVPIEDIRAVLKGQGSLETCLTRQLREFDRQRESLDAMEGMTRELLSRPGLTLEGLTEAFIRIWSRRPSLDDNPESNHYAPRNIQRDSHTVQECMLELITAMKKKRKMRFSEAFVHAPTREAVVTYFLAVLELLRLGQLHIRQTSVYGEIELIRGRYKPIRETDLTTAAGNGSTE